MVQGLRSLAITPDGNRRYAKRYNLGLEAAYSAGFKKTKEVGDWALQTGVKSLTVWGLSMDNLRKRSSTEVSLIFRLMGSRVAEALEQRDMEDKGVRVRFIGKLDMLPNSLLGQLRGLEERTADNRELNLNVALAYGGREELLNAARRLVADVKAGKVAEADVDEARFSNYMYLTEPVDMMIRTGGMRRLSGFLPWQTDYAELYFTDKLWPELSREDYDAALEYYQGTQRNFGK